jgi:hypothetical protein
VATNGSGGGAPGEGGERRRERPEVFTEQAKFVLAVWCGVTLMLVVIYAVVLLVL